VRMFSLQVERRCIESNICSIVSDYSCRVIIALSRSFPSFCHATVLLSLYDTTKCSAAISTYTLISCRYFSKMPTNALLLYRFLDVSVVDSLEKVLMPSIEPDWPLMMDSTSPKLALSSLMWGIIWMLDSMFLRWVSMLVERRFR